MPGRAERVFQPRPRGVEVAVGPVLGRGPQPQQVFDAEDDERDDLDGIEGDGIAAAERRQRFQRHRDQIDDDERDQDAVDPAAQAVADRALLEQQVDAAAQVFGVQRHAGSPDSRALVYSARPSCLAVGQTGGCAAARRLALFRPEKRRKLSR